MTTFYYHITSPERVAALDKHVAAAKAAREEAEAFAAQFLQPGQTVKVDMYSGQIRFAGARFSPEMPQDLWTSPDSDRSWQRPRAKPAGKGITAEQKTAHAALLERWNAKPKSLVSLDDLYGALIGVDNDFMMSASLVKLSDGSLLIECNRCAQVDDPGVQEILGSAYDATLKASKEVSK